MTIENALQKVLGFGSEAFVQKAIEGGWNEGKQISVQKYLMGRLPTVSVGEPSDPEEFLRAQNYLLDPKSWQAVGKVEMWYEKENWSTEKLAYVDKMYRFIDALAEGV